MVDINLAAVLLFRTFSTFCTIILTLLAGVVRFKPSMTERMLKKVGLSGEDSEDFKTVSVLLLDLAAIVLLLLLLPAAFCTMWPDTLSLSIGHLHQQARPHPSILRGWHIMISDDHIVSSDTDPGYACAVNFHLTLLSCNRYVLFVLLSFIPARHP